MPCVCLSNTITRWKTLKAEKPHHVNFWSRLWRRLFRSTKPAARPPQTFAPLRARSDDGFIYEPYLQISHVRPRLCAEFQDRSQASATPLSDIIATLTNPQPQVAQNVPDQTAPSTPAQATSATPTQATPTASTQRAFYIPQPLPLSEHPTRADLINAESRLGSTIFGPIPVGHRREFFHDHNNIWIWYEDWLDQAAQTHRMTVRYEVRTSGVFKKVAAGRYLKLEGDELENFRKATHAYLKIIKTQLYQPNILTF